jgi:quercetin dioxygenase-like cupin family protein
MAELKNHVISTRGRRVMILTALATAAGTCVLVGTALATPPSLFGPPNVVSVGHFGELDVKADKIDKWDLFLKTKDATIVSVDRLVVQPDGYSGWHTHAGPIFVTVTKGAITWQDGVDCSIRTYSAGQSFIERANQPHMVRFAASPPDGENAEFVGVQMRPEGSDGRINQPEAPCP